MRLRHASLPPTEMPARARIGSDTSSPWHASLLAPFRHVFGRCAKPPPFPLQYVCSRLLHAVILLCDRWDGHLLGLTTAALVLLVAYRGSEVAASNRFFFVGVPFGLLRRLCEWYALHVRVAACVVGVVVDSTSPCCCCRAPRFPRGSGTWSCTASTSSLFR